MRDFSIKCDHCGKDLTTTTNCEEYRIHVSVEKVPPMPGPVTLMGVSPPLDGKDHDFCSNRCLGEWLNWKK